MRISITGKICFILLIIFSLVLISTTLYQAFRERELVLKLSTEHVSSLLQSHQNGLNQIINDHPERVEAFQQNLLRQEYVLQVKWIQDQNSDASTPADNKNLPADQQEKMALQGQQLQQTISHNGRTTIVALMPYYSPEQTAPNAKPIAAIRLEYSLDKQLDAVEQHILISAIMLSAIFSGVLLMTLTIIRKQIVQPLQKLRQAIDDVTDFDDISTRLPIVQNDEIDQLNDSFNQLMERLSVKVGEGRQNIPQAEWDDNQNPPPLS